MKYNMYEQLSISQLTDLLSEVDCITFTTRSQTKKHYAIDLQFENFEEDIKHCYHIETIYHGIDHRILTKYNLEKKLWTKEVKYHSWYVQNRKGIKKLIETITDMIKAKTIGGILPYPIAFWYRK